MKYSGYNFLKYYLTCVYYKRIKPNDINKSNLYLVNPKNYDLCNTFRKSRRFQNISNKLLIN